MVCGTLTETQTLPPDVGIVTQLSGDVTYRNEEYQKTPEKAQAFMKIVQGDYFQLEVKAIVQLVYFRSGRKETWKGPSAFIAGEVQSQVKSEKGIQAQPEVKILPSGVSEGVRRVPVQGSCRYEVWVKAYRNPKCPAKKNGLKSQRLKRITGT
jgi:hypothetical protein